MLQWCDAAIYWLVILQLTWKSLFFQLCHIFNLPSDLMLFQPTISQEEKKIHKAMSSGDLGKVDTLRKSSQDGRFVPLLRFARIYICPLIYRDVFFYLLRNVSLLNCILGHCDHFSLHKSYNFHLSCFHSEQGSWKDALLGQNQVWWQEDIQRKADLW